MLASLISDGQSGLESFKEFCANLDYDPDSRKARKIWKKCQRTGDRVADFLRGDAEAFAVAAAEH